MYGNGGYEADNFSFTKDLERQDEERMMVYHSKIDVANDLDNVFGDQHEICSLNDLGHSNKLEMNSKNDECFVTNLNKRE